MRTTRWEDIKDKAQARQAALTALQSARTAASTHLTDWAFRARLQGRGLQAVTRLVNDGRDTTFDVTRVSPADRSAMWQALRQEFERPAHMALALYCAWLAQVLPPDPSTLGTRLTQALPACPPEVRTQIRQDCASDDENGPHPEIIDLVIEGIEMAEALILPGVGTVMRGQLTIDVAGLERFRELHGRKTEPEACG